jgi:hypothetical protein
LALLTDFEVERTGAHQRFVHRDRRPFTTEETELIAPYIHAVAEDIGDRRPPTEGP